MLANMHRELSANKKQQMFATSVCSFGCIRRSTHLSLQQESACLLEPVSCIQQKGTDEGGGFRQAGRPQQGGHVPVRQNEEGMAWVPGDGVALPEDIP